jgi:ADP-ribose pyrophosphatase
MQESNQPLELPTVLSSQIVFEESIVKIRRDRLQLHQRAPYTYFSLITPPYAVAILARTKDGTFVINEEYRHPTGHILLGCPGGFVDAGEDPLQAAQRELLEETGYQANSWRIMGSAYPYTGFSGQKTYFILAENAALVSQPSLEASEILRPRLFRLEELTAAIHNGANVDGVLCAALFFVNCP